MDQAGHQGKVVPKKNVNKCEAVVFTKPVGIQVDVTINAGIGGVYSLTFRYFYQGNKNTQSKWDTHYTRRDGYEYRLYRITTNPKGNVANITTTTSSMINAGKYIVRISADFGQKLYSYKS